MARSLQLSEEKFKAFVRYMIHSAKQKRCVPYVELENVFGLGHDGVGMYAGVLGDYCNARKIPILNRLIVSSTDCTPSEGFAWYQKKYGRSWVEIVSECWRYFHLTSSRSKQSQHFSGRDRDIQKFLGGK